MKIRTSNFYSILVSYNIYNKTNTPEETRMLRNDTASFSFSTFNLIKHTLNAY